MRLKLAKVRMGLTRAGWGPLQAAPNAACACPHPAGPFEGKTAIFTAEYGKGP